MDAIENLDSIDQYNRLREVPTLHPLISVIDLAEARLLPARTFHFGLYAIFLKELRCGELRYGRKSYHYQEGTLVFVAPGKPWAFSPSPRQGLRSPKAGHWFFIPT